MIRAANPTDYKPVTNPARFEWHEVSKIQHYWLDVNTITRPMRGREDSPPNRANHQ